MFVPSVGRSNPADEQSVPVVFELGLQLSHLFHGSCGFFCRRFAGGTRPAKEARFNRVHPLPPVLELCLGKRERIATRSRPARRAARVDPLEALRCE